MATTPPSWSWWCHHRPGGGQQPWPSSASLLSLEKPLSCHSCAALGMSHLYSQLAQDHEDADALADTDAESADGEQLAQDRPPSTTSFSLCLPFCSEPLSFSLLHLLLAVTVFILLTAALAALTVQNPLHSANAAETCPPYPPSSSPSFSSTSVHSTPSSSSNSSRNSSLPLPLLAPPGCPLPLPFHSPLPRAMRRVAGSMGQPRVPADVRAGSGGAASAAGASRRRLQGLHAAAAGRSLPQWLPPAGRGRAAVDVQSAPAVGRLVWPAAVATWQHGRTAQRSSVATCQGGTARGSAHGLPPAQAQRLPAVPPAAAAAHAAQAGAGGRAGGCVVHPPTLPTRRRAAGGRAHPARGLRRRAALPGALPHPDSVLHPLAAAAAQ